MICLAVCGISAKLLVTVFEKAHNVTYAYIYITSGCDFLSYSRDLSWDLTCYYYYKLITALIFFWGGGGGGGGGEKGGLRSCHWLAEKM